MEQFLLEKIKKLGIKEFENFNSLNLMDGNCNGENAELVLWKKI